MSEDGTRRDAESRKLAREQAERRRRLAAAFGDALPERTSDECNDAWGDSPAASGGAGHDEWLHSQVPPHHGE